MHERQNFHYYISIFPKILWRFYFMIGVWIIFYHGLDGDLQEVFFYSFASCVVVRLPGEDQTVWVIECVGRDQTLLQCSFVSADRLQHTSTRHHPYQHAAFKTCLLFQASVHVLLTGDCPLYWNQKQTLVHVRYYLSVTLIQYKFIDKYIFELDSRNPPNLFVYWITESLLWAVFSFVFLSFL